MSTGPEHYAEAERLLLEPLGSRGPEWAAVLVAQAQVHATLALAAASASHFTSGGMDGDDFTQWRTALLRPRGGAS